MTHTTQPSRARAVLADFEAGLTQQMFFWGRDVLCHGNLLAKHGFTKHPSPGLKGTSCYRKRHEQGFLELHGACVGWYPDEGQATPGLLYVKATRRCATHQFSQAVVPGQTEGLAVERNCFAVLPAAQHFAAWLAEYEAWVLKKCGLAYRMNCRTHLSRLPLGKLWLPPEYAQRWIQEFAVQGEAMPRALKKRSAREEQPKA
jgi:hypothetical protein